VPDEHALLSPSSAERWIHCPASVRMAAAQPPEPDSPYAAEGTSAHTLGELRLRQAFGQVGEYEAAVLYRQWLAGAQANGYDVNTMNAHAAEYAQLVRDRAAVHPASAVMAEQRVQTGIEGCWGTADCVIVSPTHVEIIDLKYGQGVRVSPVENPQLMLYGVGALEMFGDTLGVTETVYVTVFQPRLDHTETWCISAGDLRAWRDSLRPIAADALAGSDRFGPGEATCRWCPAAGVCAARSDYVLRQDFAGNLDEMDPADLAEALALVPTIRQWCDDIQAHAMRLVYAEGQQVPGWKVVRGRGRRAVTDEAAAVQRLVEAGFTEDDVVQRKLLGITALDKLVGRDHLANVLGDLIQVTEGGPALVPESDRRPSINPNDSAAKEFSDADA